MLQHPWRAAVSAGIAALILAVTVEAAPAVAPRRLSREIQGEQRVVLSGNVRPRVALAEDAGTVSSSMEMPGLSMSFQPTPQQRADLQQLLREQQTPGSPNYHKFLTPEQFADRFGPHPDDVAKVSAWLQTQGFTNIRTARSRTFVTFEGTAAQVQNAFETTIHRVNSNGEAHYANLSEPHVPAELDGFVQHIRGLHDFKRHAKLVRRNRRPEWTSNLSGSHFLAPGDLATLYDIAPIYQSGFDGTGVKIAVVGQSQIDLNDIAAFRTNSGIPANPPQVIVTGADPGIVSGDEEESELDLEWSGAIARNASVVFVTSKYVETAAQFAVDNNVAPIVSISYGICESELSASDAAADADFFQQANAQGITVIAASGDSGAADCDSKDPATGGLAVDESASLPYVTGIGGTTLADSSGNYWNGSNNATGGGSLLSYIPETAWNDTAVRQELSASGGGQSLLFPKPAWQAGPGVPADGARDVPDLSFAASPEHDGYLTCLAGSCVNGFRLANSNLTIYGGTSVGAPVFAGIMALVVQKFGPQGNVNPLLYSLAANTSNVFHDVTNGTNIVPCAGGTRDCNSHTSNVQGTLGYFAGPGYDQVTGLGSVDAYQLWTQWRSDYPALVASASQPLGFVPMTPCRVADTRAVVGPFGGPQMQSGQTREFDLPAGACNIPQNAAAYSLNVTAVPTTSINYLTVWPSAQPRPFVSTLNSDGRIKANAAIVPAGTNGGISVYVTDQTQVILDVNGYFVPSSGLQFFPVQPCRAADTRVGTGPLGGPALTAGQIRDFPLLSSQCGIPATAQAYSLNVTAVPQAPLLYLTAWPSGQTQPDTSTLNALSATATANAAIVPAGTNGSVAIYATANTQLILDVNGYFAPPATGGSYLHAVQPCRVSDTRNPAGSAPVNGSATVNVTASGCQIPATAQAFVLNATAVPPGPLTYLTLWPAGSAIPFVSTLNADPGTITSNLAIVPSGGGSVGTFTSQASFLILDVFGYFAP